MMLVAELAIIEHHGAAGLPLVRFQKDHSTHLPLPEPFAAFPTAIFPIDAGIFQQPRVEFGKRDSLRVVSIPPREQAENNFQPAPVVRFDRNAIAHTPRDNGFWSLTKNDNVERRKCEKLTWRDSDIP